MEASIETWRLSATFDAILRRIAQDVQQNRVERYDLFHTSEVQKFSSAEIATAMSEGLTEQGLSIRAAQRDVFKDHPLGFCHFLGLYRGDNCIQLFTLSKSGSGVRLDPGVGQG